MKVIDDLGVMDNTLIIYITGDNGSSANGGQDGRFNIYYTFSRFMLHNLFGSSFTYGMMTVREALAGANNALYLYCTSRENDPSLAAVAMNVFDTSEVVVDPKGAVRSQPFKHYLARRKHDSDRNSTNTAYPARVFITQELKHPQLGRRVFCNR